MRSRRVPRVARAFALAAIMLPAATSAWADCTPASADNVIATCTGTTTNQGGGAPGTSVGNDGYGTGAETGITVNLTSGTITGTNNGIFIQSGTVTNSGSIAGGQGITANGTVTVTNNAGATISGSLGINASGTVTVTNSGSIVGGGFANIDSFGGNVILINNAGAEVSGGFFGVISGGGGGGTSVVNAGTISAGSRAIQFTGTGNTVTNNAGGILTGGELAILSLGSGTKVFNAGTISGPTAIEFVGGNNELTNNAGGSITGTQVGISALAGGSNVFNAGTISGGTAIQFAGVGNTLTLAPGSVITGNVLGTGNDTFQLGGSGAATFDVSQLGAAAQYGGFGTFNKIDGSTWTLTGNSTFAGPVNVNGGTLSVNGDISSASSLTVNAGGTLGGNGIVGNTTINGGTLAPGNSIGLLTVNGNLAFTAASTYMVEVSSTTADRTNVTGTATLGGATVNAVVVGGTVSNQRYTILNATGGVVGTFNSAVMTLPDLRGNLSYDANDAYLNFTLNYGSGLNTNQQNVANALTKFFNSTGGIQMLYAALTPAALTQASGESATGTQQTTFNAMSQFMGVMTDPFVAGRGDPVSAGGGATGYADEANAYAAKRKPNDALAAIYTKANPIIPFEARWSTWAAGYGGSQTTDGNAVTGSNNTTSSVAATAVGADYRFSPFTIAGFALAGGGTSFSVNGSGSGHSDLFQAGAFVRHDVGSAYILASLAYGWQDITTNRTVTVAGSDQLRAEFNANAFSGRLEGGYRFVTPYFGGVGITPYAAGQFTTFDLPSYAEAALSGSSAFALSYGSQSVTDARSELGIRTDKSYAVQGGIFTLRGRFAWAHDYDPNRAVAATFQALPGASFVVNGAAQAADSALTTASAEMKWTNNWSIAATFEGEFSDVTRSYAGKGVVRYAW
jgi:uncharacterized protein with beta-barrel porin domain